MVVIEMNPRVSRSSALASKATGFPIAKIAAKLAVGYTLDEIPNDITRKTPACFEPTLDYVVVKIPKWQFEKFPGADDTLGPQMKSVGEVMAIGRTFKEALMKGIRSLDTGKRVGGGKIEPKILTQRLVTPHPERLAYVQYALRQGHTVKQIAKMTSMDPWFLYQLKEINDQQLELEKHPMESIPTEVLRESKRMGFSDGRLAQVWRLEGQEKVRHLRKKHGVMPVYKRVDTCAAEFESHTPYLYSTYEDEDEAAPTDKKKVIILGSGPNRIGQGIEFDYCCCHASFALHEDGFETIMINCNPETVSTDYDTSDRLYFEPLTFEDVWAIYQHETSKGADVRRDRAVRRTDSAESRAAAEEGWREDYRHVARIDRSRRRPQALQQTARRIADSASARRDGHFDRTKRSKAQSKSAIPCWCALPTCSAGAPWSSPTTKNRSSAT